MILVNLQAFPVCYYAGSSVSEDLGMIPDNLKSFWRSFHRILNYENSLSISTEKV